MEILMWLEDERDFFLMSHNEKKGNNIQESSSSL